jgi:hypothetical protein
MMMQYDTFKLLQKIATDRVGLNSLKEIVSTTMFRDNLQFKGNLQSKTYGIV